ncbi:MAG: YHS domain-containing (seleno)protein [Planctomycetota bacterium]
MTRRISLPLLTLILAAGGFLAAPAHAHAHDSAEKAGEAVNTDKTGLALRGYDPVSFFVGDEPQQGNFQIAAQHHGATYWFASEDNKKTFEADPHRYLPQFGGYCAYGVAIGRKFSADPEVYLVRDGKLYVNLNPAIAEVFTGDLDKHIDDAQSNWSRIADTPADEIE